MLRAGGKGWRVACAGAALLALCVISSVPAAAAGPSEKRVVGGVEADPADWPFAAAVVTQGNQFCGGSVIAPKAVLTAAHCVFESSLRMRVVTGRPDLTDTSVGESIKVKKYRVHPDYPRRFDHDLAVLRLREPTVAPPATLPSRPQDDAETGVGAALRVAGWGSTVPEGNPGSPVLLTTPQNVIGANACENAFGGFQVEEEICTRGEPISGGGYTSSCFGDSGGPLMADPVSGTPLLVGVVSYGGRRCGVNKPTVYARVAAGLRFIRAAAGR